MDWIRREDLIYKGNIFKSVREDVIMMEPLNITNIGLLGTKALKAINEETKEFIKNTKCDCRQCDGEGSGCGSVDLQSITYKANGEVTK